jgi:hypothetical protein
MVQGLGLYKILMETADMCSERAVIGCGYLLSTVQVHEIDGK